MAKGIKSKAAFISIILVCFGIISLGIGLPANGASLLYLGMWDSPTSVTVLGNYNPGTQALTQVNSPFASFAFLAISPSRVLYGVDGGNLYTIDQTAGSVTLVGMLHTDAADIECAGLTFKPDGTMLVHEYSNRSGSWVHKLYSGDPATGVLTFIADITGLTTGLYGIEYVNGTLYGSYDQALYTINITTGAATLIGTGTSAWDLDFGQDGILRGSGPDGKVYAVDPATATSTVIRDFRTVDNKDPWGIASLQTFITVKADQTGDYPTIQAAIDAAGNGDVILLYPGTYTGAGNRDIDFKGKRITIRSTNPDDWSVVSATMIDCQGSQSNQHRGFYFHTSETNQSILAGITMTNGYLYNTGSGGAICCRIASPTITRCKFISNYCRSGGGAIYGNDASFPVISNCQFINNTSGSHGGAIASAGPCTIMIKNSIFTGNSAPRGGGVLSSNSVVIANCTFNQNTATIRGGGLFLTSGNPIVTNCIFWGDTSPLGPEIGMLGANLTITYSDVQGGSSAVYCDSSTLNWGSGNITPSDPGFVSPGSPSYDYHLSANLPSPCINTGDPNGDYTGQKDIDGQERVSQGRVDIGSDEVP
jgi:predicted outer membrane repeat protein